MSLSASDTKPKEEKNSRESMPAPALKKESGVEPGRFAIPSKPSAGEKFFNRFTYTGLGYFLNLAVSLVVWDYFMKGRGRPTLDAIASGTEKMFRATGMTPAQASKWGKVATEMSFSTAGGHLVVLGPLYMAEKHARYITHKGNQWFDKNYAYKDLQVSWNTPEDQLPRMVEEPTDQKFWQIAARRALSTVVVSASGSLLHKAGWDKPLQDNTVAAFNKGVNLTGSPALQSFAQRPVVKRYVEMAALDAYFTGITSAIVAFTNTMFGKKKNGVHHGEEAKVPTAVAAAPAAPAPSAPETSKLAPAGKGEPSPVMRVEDGLRLSEHKLLADKRDFRTRRKDAEPQLQLGA